MNEAANYQDMDNVRRLFDEPQWSPVDEQNRHQKYRKNIRPQNETQARLLAAMSEKPLVFAVGAAGTGKSLLAKYIHYNGARRNEPLVDLNCAAIPGALIEAWCR